MIMEKVKVCRFCLCDNKFVDYVNLFSDLPMEFLLKIKNCLSVQVLYVLDFSYSNLVQGNLLIGYSKRWLANIWLC